MPPAAAAAYDALPLHGGSSETVDEPSELTSDQAVSLDEQVESSASGDGRKCRLWG